MCLSLVSTPALVCSDSSGSASVNVKQTAGAQASQETSALRARYVITGIITTLSNYAINSEPSVRDRIDLDTKLADALDQGILETFACYLTC